MRHRQICKFFSILDDYVNEVPNKEEKDYKEQVGEFFITHFLFQFYFYNLLDYCYSILVKFAARDVNTRRV